MAKIIHTGDIHLDSAFVTLRGDAPRARRSSLREIVSKIIDIANAESVDAVLFAGDLFDAYPIRPETAESVLRDFKRAKMPIFLSPGNHDPYTSDSPYKTLEFPENVHIFKSPELTAVTIPEKNLRIFGAAYVSDVCDDRILDGFKVPDDEFINIISLHSNLYTEGYSPVSAEEIEKTNADYVALAHVHKPTDILKAKNTYYAYCGCAEARDFGEQYDTGIYIGDVTKGNVSLTHRRISDISYREITFDVKNLSDVTELLPVPEGREYLRLTVVGECEAFDEEDLANRLGGRYEHLEIYDRTEAPRDIWQGLSEDTLRGAFLRKMKARIDECDDPQEKQKFLLAARLGIDAIENRDV